MLPAMSHSFGIYSLPLLPQLYLLMGRGCSYDSLQKSVIWLAFSSAPFIVRQLSHSGKAETTIQGKAGSQSETMFENSSAPEAI